MEFALGLLALAYSGLVLFALANALKKLYAPMRAALSAVAISSVVHGATTLLMGEHMVWALAFWGIPHLLVLPALLWSARKQTP